MATADEEHFLRSSLLLVKGSLFITKKILIREEQREIQQTGRDIDDLLKSYKQKLEQQFQNYKQRAILFPQNGKTEVEKWDISLLTGVLLIVFNSSLSDDERIAVKHIKYQRNEIYAHPAVASLSVNDYNDICSELKAAYDTLASGFSSDVKEQCNNIVETCLKGPLDLKTSLEQLKKMSETDDKFREILTRIDTSGKETTLALTNTFRQESSALKGGISMEISRSENNICDTIRDLQLKKEDLYEIVLNAVRQVQQEKRVKRKVKVVDSELEVSGNETDQPRVDEAKEILVRVTKEAIRRAQTSKENIYIREKIQEILDNIECQTDLKALTAEKGCVIIRFDCSTYEQLFNLIIYMESKDMKQRLNKLAVALSCRLNTKDKLHVSFSLSFKTLQSIVEELEANCRREYKRSVRIPIQVESVQGMNRLFELFERGGLTNNLNKLSEALTEKVGAKINVKSSININQLKEALEEFDHVRKATMQIDKTEDRSSEKKGKDKDDKKEDDGASIVYELKTAVKDASTVENIYSQTFKTDRDSDWQRQEREIQIPNDENEYRCRSSPTPLPRRDAYKEDGELSIPPITAYDDISSDIKPKMEEAPNPLSEVVRRELEEAAQGGIAKLMDHLQRKNEEWKRLPLNIAITGESGAGKSSFINAIRGLTEDDEEGAHVDVVEATREIKSYKHPHNPNLMFWDLPGVGTLSFPRTTYLKDVKFDRFDFVLIMSAGRFREDILWLAKEICQLKKNFHFVRTHMDIEVEIDKKSHPKTHSKVKLIEKIRDDSLKILRAHDLTRCTVFLIDNYAPTEFDFNALAVTLIDEIPVHKREAMALSIPVLTEGVLEKKVEALTSRIYKVSLLSAIAGAIPVPGTGAVVNGAILLNEVTLYKSQLGLDRKTMDENAHLLKTEARELEKRLGLQSVTLPTTAIGLIQAVPSLAASEAVKCSLPIGFLFIGSLISAGLSYSVSVASLKYLLNICVNDARKINSELMKNVVD